MLNNLLNTIESLEERDLSVPFTSNDINESGMIIIKSYELLGSVGLNISGLFYPVLEDLNINVPMLVVDGDFEELSTITKQFIIAHELGHCKYHLNKAEIEKAREINHEFEADSYAVEFIGKENVILALKEIKEMMDWAPEECLAEIDNRINNL